MTSLSFFLRRTWLNLILGAILGGLVVNCLCGRLGPRDLLALRRHRIQLVVLRDQLLSENAQLNDRATHLRSDDAYLRRLIRKELGYAYRDEFVYRFPDRGDTP